MRSWIINKQGNSDEAGDDVGKDTERRTVGGRGDATQPDHSRDLIRALLLLARAQGVNDKSSRHEHRAFSRAAVSLPAVVPLCRSLKAFLSRRGGEGGGSSSKRDLSLKYARDDLRFSRKPRVRARRTR